MKRLALILPAATLLFAGCSHPPRLDNEVANRHRAIMGPGTPKDRDDELEGVLNGERKDDLRSLAKRAKEGDSIDVKLGPGIYVIDDPIVVRGAKLVIRGPGADLARIELKSDDWRALTVEGSPNVEIRGVTIAGYTGGGIDIRNSSRVVVNEVDFAGSRYGIELDECQTAYIDSCVFAGCEKAIKIDNTRLTMRGTAITECWGSLEGSGVIDALGCVFAANVDGASVTVRPGSRFRSCLFGRLETFNTVGNPDVRSSYLFDDLYERFHLMADADNNVVLHDIGEFPDIVMPPRGCHLGAISYAIERTRTRGMKKPNEKIRDVLEAEARKYADAASKAVAKKELSAAKWLQQIALDYCQATGGSSEALRAQIQGIVP